MRRVTDHRLHVPLKPTNAKLSVNENVVAWSNWCWRTSISDMSIANKEPAGYRLHLPVDPRSVAIFPS